MLVHTPLVATSFLTASHVSWSQNHHSLPSLSSGTTALSMSSSNEEDDVDYPVDAASLLDTWSLFATQPILGGFPLVYPLVLGISPLVLPWTTSLLWILSFGVFWYLGSQVLQMGGDDDYDDDERSMSSSVLAAGAFVGGLLTAGLLSPDNNANASPFVVVLLVIGTIATTLGKPATERPTFEEDQVSDFDDRLFLSTERRRRPAAQWDQGEGDKQE